MNETDQRIAIATAMRWRDVEKDPFTNGLIWGTQPISHDAGVVDRKVPDYLNDLNAMNEAEKVLSDDIFEFVSQLDHYEGILKEICKNQRIFSATAAQRAEAFLKTIGKWKEDK